MNPKYSWEVWSCLGQQFKPCYGFDTYHPSIVETSNSGHITAWLLDDSENVSPVPDCNYDASAEAVNFTVTRFGKYAISFVIKTFNDLTGYSWAKNQIEAMASRGIINGTSSDTFSPEANITRADFVKLLVTELGFKADVTDNFPDVSEAAYYYNTVGIQKKLDIACANANGNFNPTAYITRQDMMVMTANALNIAKPDMPSGSSMDLSEFSDKDKLSVSAIDAVATLVKNGVITGTNGSSILPEVYVQSRSSRHIVPYTWYGYYVKTVAKRYYI